MTAGGRSWQGWKGLTTVRVVEVKYSLDSKGLETIDERASVGVEWSI